MRVTVPGSGRKVRMATPKSTAARQKIDKTMTEFGQGQLHSGSKQGPLVQKRSQALAIAISQARRKAGM